MIYLKLFASNIQKFTLNQENYVQTPADIPTPFDY